MSTSKSLLTILITTYNRAPVLDKELEILYGYEKRGLMFDVMVSNDCSSDNTEEICMKVGRKYLWHDKCSNVCGNKNNNVLTLHPQKDWE